MNQPAYQICQHCGIPKNVWKDGKDGAPGFWGCPNWKSHPKRQPTPTFQGPPAPYPQQPQPYTPTAAPAPHPNAPPAQGQETQRPDHPTKMRQIAFLSCLKIAQERSTSDAPVQFLIDEATKLAEATIAYAIGDTDIDL